MPESSPPDPSFESLLEYLKESRGFDFTGYKRSSLSRRISGRMLSLDLHHPTDYQDYLEVHPEEFTHLFNYILINVTSFFRDPAVWDYVASTVIPAIIEAKAPDEPIRAWSAGCASGEEAFSVAMLLAEALGTDRFIDTVKIFGTDMDDEALTQARQATYTAKDLDPVPPDLRERFFTPVRDQYVFSKELRQSVIFGRHDLVQDAPISRIDILICRNTLMYLNAQTQAKVLSQLSFALADKGYLVLGKAEMLFTQLRRFEPVDLKRRVFAKAGSAEGQVQPAVAAADGSVESVGRLANHLRGRELAFESAPVGQIVVNRAGNVILANAQARAMFKMAEVDVGRPLQDLELSYRPLELRSRIDQVYANGATVIERSIPAIDPDGHRMNLDVELAPLRDGQRVVGVSITFADVTRFSELQDELQGSNQELETAMEELQSANEELETTNEELHSTNEELETTNEELQSTNEELETMNEELQSTNEELQAMNEEMRERTEQLDEANSFLGTILSSVRSGVAVLDQDLRVQVWNERAYDLWGLHSEDVKGQPFLSLDIGLPVESLARELRRTTYGESSIEELVVLARNRRGREFECRVTATPLMSPRGVVGAIVLMDEEERKTET
jgi:two-component system CheB/CheR fusion protein